MSWLSSSLKNLFGLKKKDPPEIKSPYDTGEYQQRLKTLRERIAGKNLGLPGELLEKTTSPFATNLRAGFQKYTVPAIASAASARGLGRSSLVPAQIGEQSRQVEGTIDERLANLIYENEVRKKQEQEAASTELANVGLGKTDVENQRILANYETQKGNEAARMAGFGRAGAIIGPLASSIYSSVTKPSSVDWGKTIGDMITGGAGTVNTGGQSSDTLMQILKILATVGA